MYRSQVLPIYSHSTLSFGEYLLIPRYCQGFWGFISKQGGQSPILLFKNTPLQKFFCFWLYCATCKILASWPVIKPGPWQQKCQVLTMESQRISQSPILVRGTPNEQQINTECASGHDWCCEKHKAEDEDKENGGWVGSDTMVSWLTSTPVLSQFNKWILLRWQYGSVEVNPPAKEMWLILRQAWKFHSPFWDWSRGSCWTKIQPKKCEGRPSVLASVEASPTPNPSLIKGKGLSRSLCLDDSCFLPWTWL